MIQAFRDGIDFHSLTASIISGKDIDEVTAEKRAAVKALNFGILFGMGVKDLVSYAESNYNVSLSIREAELFQDTFFKKYWKLARRRDWQSQKSSTRTLGGRVRHWQKRLALRSVTELINTPI